MDKDAKIKIAAFAWLIGLPLIVTLLAFISSGFAVIFTFTTLIIAVIAVFRPIKLIGILSRVVAAFAILGSLIGIIIVPQMVAAELAQLRVSNPTEYLERIKKRDEGFWLSELRELNPEALQIELQRRKEEADRHGWANAQAANTIQSYRAYIATYLQGEFVQEAEAKASALRTDQAPYDTALRLGTEAALKKFLTDYPGHEKEDEAQQTFKDIVEGGHIVDLLDEKKIALIQASQEGHGGIVQALLASGAEIDHQDEDGWTALYMASQNGHEGIVQALMARGAEIDHQAKNGYTALILASKNGHEGVVQALLAKGGEIDIQGEDGATALIQSSQEGHEGIVQALLAKGAEVNHQAKNGVTALFIAANQGHQEVVKALLAKGANVELRENGGGTALKYAKTQQIKQLLRAAGATQ